MRDTRNTRELRFTHFGAAGWSITDGETVILLDPYLSRVRFQGRRYGPHDATDIPNDPRPVVRLDESAPNDTATIDRHVPKADYILLSHSHFNHAMDMPYIARRTGAVVIGTESTCNIAANGGVPDEQIHAVRGGEDYEYKTFSLKVIPSLHSALSCKLYKDFGTVPQKDGPLQLDEFVEGGTLAYQIRIGGREILLFGSMNYIEREVEGLRPDVVFVASAPPRLEIHAYTERLLRSLGRPRLVVATHWDDQGLPFGASQDKALAQTDAFIREVKAVSPDSEVFVPPHFQTLVLDASGTMRVAS
ncbi:MBL fold metallo-hydrolase [Enterovirga rhinocerotis]|uniref:L-ascorbate metabolism protein UlaG (Beta-lactamase superfamily) n=1 Tax=Enterovirga rhinocerotis TaxID=1339210 RepID=A0A4R7C9T0_9HYPH|nr:MBL fold metallo-hydrolase [Enterovirga rhinocerotis]TDR93527.1 L-ascorbate metabolism protein UlaG (beta-lactamase superfamily) [Enterovirga rhinocerotis]